MKSWLLGSAFALADDFADNDIEVEGDSLLLVEQVLNLNLQPDWMIEAEVRTMTALLRTHPRWSVQWTSRDGNFLAHNLAWLAWNLVTHGNLSVDMVT